MINCDYYGSYTVFKKKECFFAMTGHVIYKNIDKLNTATHSKKVINHIRNIIGFKNIIISDDLSMKALSGDIISKVKKTYDAGCDVILYCQGILDEMKKMYPFSRKIDVDNFKYFISRASSTFSC